MAQKNEVPVPVGFLLWFIVTILTGIYVYLMIEFMSSLVICLITVPYISAMSSIYRYMHRYSEGPIQELKILVDLPVGVNVKSAALVLNSVDVQLLSYLLKKCTVSTDYGQIFLHYKRHGTIFNAENGYFEINGGVYRPSKIKVLYCG